MPKYELQLNRWDILDTVEAGSLSDAKVVYMKKYGIHKTSKTVWAVQTNVGGPASTEPTEEEVARQELVQEAMSLGIDGAAKMDIEELTAELIAASEPEDDEEEEDDEEDDFEDDDEDEEKE